VAVFHPIRPHRTFEHAVAQIAEAIANGSLRPGQGLPGERKLAVEMDVSRRTIREAIKVLADAGVVQIVPGPGGGTTVRSEVVPKDLTHQIETHVSELSDVLEARRVLEPRIAQLAGVYAEREDLEELERIVKLQRENTGDRERYLALESRFHLMVARSARNAVLYDTMKSLFGRVLIAADLTLELGRAGAVHQRALEAIDIHERNVEALRSRDPALIEAIMDEHLRFLEDEWMAQGGRLRYRSPHPIMPQSGDGVLEAS